MEDQNQNSVPPSEPPPPTIVATEGLAYMRTLLTSIESAAAFDALAQSWFDEYACFRSEAIDHQILKLIEADWLHQRALLSIWRGEEALFDAERYHEGPDRIQHVEAFLARMQRRYRAYQRMFRGALATMESLRKARIAETLTHARIVLARLALRRGQADLVSSLQDRSLNSQRDLRNEMSRVAHDIPDFPFHKYSKGPQA